MARKFLFIVAILIGLVLLAGVAWSQFGDRLMRMAMVPSAPFVEQKRLAANIYASKQMWIARPDLPGNPALWMPPGFKDDAPRGNAAIFFIHPTSYLDRTHWNAPLDDKAANDRAVLFVQGQASAFSNAGEIWVPRYRQATFGAFLTTQVEATKALNAAYADVETAWDAFLAAVPANRPIIVAGHSQGSVHLLRLLRERIAGKSVARRIVAAYVVGWPISVETDLPALGFPACAQSDQAQCLLSWQSFAEPADMAQIVEVFDATTGFNGQPRRDTKMLCVNPITGVLDSAAEASANLGTLVPSADLKTAAFEIGKLPARCDARGFLLIGPPPADIGEYILPGNNYHVFDYSLFWANVRADAGRRLAAFKAL